MILRLAMLVLVGGLFLSGCSAPEPGCLTCLDPSPPTTTGGACTGTIGQIEGSVSLFEPPSSPDSVYAPNALIMFRRNPEAEPLIAMADDTSHFEADLAEGAWIVGGESADGYCTTFEPKTITIERCQLTFHEVVLEACVN